MEPEEDEDALEKSPLNNYRCVHARCWEGQDKLCRSGWLYHQITLVLRYAENLIKTDPELRANTQCKKVYTTDLVHDNQITITKTLTDYDDCTYAYQISFKMDLTLTPIYCDIDYEELYNLFKLTLYCKIDPEGEMQKSMFTGEFDGHSFEHGKCWKNTPDNSDSDSEDQIVCEGPQGLRTWQVSENQIRQFRD